MFEIFKQRMKLTGSVYFNGDLPPRPEEFSHLQQDGITLTQLKSAEGVRWALRLDHPQWGDATMMAMDKVPHIPGPLIDFDPTVEDNIKASLKHSRCRVGLVAEPKAGNIARDRKRFLRFLGAILGPDGLSAVDHYSQRFWSRTALDEEMAHDADVDVTALYTVHVVHSDEDQTACWLHTHGLAELGTFDFDVIMPSEDLLSISGQDVLRAAAYAILENSVTTNTPRHTLAYPGGDVRFVDVGNFNASAPGRFVRLREFEDPEHNRKRAILCEPARGLLGRWSKKIQPSSFLREPISDHIVMAFSDAATELMADRARETISVFRRLFDEFRDLEFNFIVKLGYPTETDNETGGKEHLWFTAHECMESHIDATLENDPHQIPSLKRGMRSDHPIDLVTDWMILTPFGPIDPRNMSAARTIRDRKNEILAAIRDKQ